MSVFADEIQRLETEVAKLRDNEARLLRVNADLEDQIHEEDGFIDRIVALEEENANLKTTVEEDLLYIRSLEERLMYVEGDDYFSEVK